MARRVAPVVEVMVALAGLPKELEGFTIAQISDLHVGPTIKRNFVAAVVDRVNRLQADMVAITGDVVDGSVPDLAHHTEPLARLVSRHGTYFVTGNHEYYSGAHEWIREFERLGARVLMNEHVVLDHDGAALTVAGVTDWSAHHFDPSHKSDPHAAGEGAPAHALKVLLAHQPRSALSAEAAGYHLQLSGHTHGGQFWPPVDLHQLRHRLLGAADAIRDSLGDHAHPLGRGIAASRITTQDPRTKPEKRSLGSSARQRTYMQIASL
jgi:predicted MPP superfamily phosphohydrolase